MRLSAVVLIAAFAAPALAQEAPLTKVYACADIKDGSQRLACYDAAVGKLKSSEDSGGVAVVTREQIQKVEKDAFGLTVPSVSELASNTIMSPKAEKPKPLDSVALPVKAVEQQPDGRLLFVMENGQVWKQTDAMKIGKIGKGPWQAEIKKAALGSFMLKLNGATAVRVERSK